MIFFNNFSLVESHNLYKSALKKKEEERKFSDQQALVDAAIVQAESYSRRLEEVFREEVEAKKKTLELPLFIEAIETKIIRNQLLSSPDEDASL